MQPSQKPIGIIRAILTGWLIVNLPVALIMIGLNVLGLFFFFSFWYLILVTLASSFIIAWIWWAYTVPRWRNWAVQQGCDAEELHKAAVAAGLEWPKGCIFEKTEIKPKSSVIKAATDSTPPEAQTPEPEALLSTPTPAANPPLIEQPTVGKPFPIRTAASVIDYILSLVVFLPIEFLIIFLMRIVLNTYGRSAGVFFETAKTPYVLSLVLVTVLYLVYMVFFTWLSGTTPGKLLFNMRVATESGERVGLKASFIRSVAFFFDSLFFGMIAYIKMKPPLYQRNGDILAKTIVVGKKDPIIKQKYSRWQFLVSSAIYLIGSVLIAVIFGISTIGPMQTIIKVPAAQINLQKSDLGELATQKNEKNEIPSTDKTVVDVNERYFNFRGHKVVSKITAFNYFPSETNDSLKQSDELSLKEFFTDPDIKIERVQEYINPSGPRGSILEFYSPGNKLAGYTALLCKKNVVVHLIVYSIPNAVNPDEIQQLIEIIFSRIP